jgi:hypothetical protein
MAIELVAADERASERSTLADRGVAARYAALVGRRDIANAIVDRLGQTSDRERYPEGFEEFFETLRLLGRDNDVRRFLEPARHLALAEVLLAPVADRAEGDLRLKAGQRDEARRLLESAVQGFDRLSVPFEAAQARELLAQVSEPDEARALIDAAVETFVQLGARPYADAARARLAQLV